MWPYTSVMQLTHSGPTAVRCSWSLVRPLSFSSRVAKHSEPIRGSFADREALLMSQTYSLRQKDPASHRYCVDSAISSLLE